MANNYCFCTLAMGEVYRKHSQKLIQDLQIFAPGVPLVILTDKPRDFAGMPNAIAFKHKQQSIGCYHDKRFVIQKALELFNSGIYVDADLRIIGKVPAGLNFSPGILAKNCFSILKRSHRVREFEVVKGAAEKLELGLPDIKFVNEYLFAVTRQGGAENNFIDLWGRIGDYFELRGIYGGEGSVIGLAAAKAKYKIQRFDTNPLLDSILFFKHVVYAYNKTKGFPMDAQSEAFNKEYLLIRFPERPVIKKMRDKLIKYIERVMFLIRLRIRSLKDGRFYYG